MPLNPRHSTPNTPSIPSPRALFSCLSPLSSPAHLSLPSCPSPKRQMFVDGARPTSADPISFVRDAQSALSMPVSVAVSCSFARLTKD